MLARYQATLHPEKYMQIKFKVFIFQNSGPDIIRGVANICSYRKYSGASLRRASIK
ncbi:hypothetical protein [uncultured Pontibacter sp.]|uniref:hypothetical protein n=1 Tax=uncultured Pontibacter sp. TaxID=453356 RepID=UPI002609E172|nr:hypothetical protein [uncultured Pontibacter sp.]